jgi:hypothetical protein
VTPSTTPSTTPRAEEPPVLTNVVVALVVVVLGAAALAGSLGLGVGVPSAPGPGTWPALVSTLLIVLGIALGVRARRTTDAEPFTRSGLLVAGAVAGMAGFVAVVGVIGFEIPAALLAFAWMRFLGRESWRTSVIVSLATTVAFYVIFVGALDVTIPHLF